MHHGMSCVQRFFYQNAEFRNSCIKGCTYSRISSKEAIGLYLEPVDDDLYGIPGVEVVEIAI
jgi:hypothetical protein